MINTRYSLWWSLAILLALSASTGAFCPPTPFLLTKTSTSTTTTALTAVDKDKDTQPKGEIVKSEFYLDLLEAVWTVGSEIARETFFALRRTAANALTASLPENERQELLERTFGKQKIQAMSVQENQAAARVTELQRNPQQWEKEKEAIYLEAEQAATERVETELAIQKARMDQERQEMEQEATAAQQQLQAEKDALQAFVTEKKQALVVNPQQEQAKLSEALQQKEQQAKQDQETITQLEQKLQAQTTPAPLPDTSKPQIRAGQYTPSEWRSLTDDEKEQVMVLRKEQGPTTIVTPQEPTTSTASDVHPILGPVLQDLGYKRIHILSVGKLGTIPIWKKQRIYRHDRAKAMVDDKWKSMSLGLPGVICLTEDSNDGKLAIIDGQHRVGMMILLRNKQRKYLQDHPEETTSFPAIDFDRVVVEVYPSGQSDVEEHTQKMFLEINKAEPVKLIDMPGVASAKDRQIISQAVEKLFESYTTMFSPSQRCRTPNVNVDNLRNALFGSGCIKTHNLTSSTKLYEWILEQNDLVGDKFIDSKEEQSKINANAWKKARENKFYLGLESTWLYN